MPCWPIDMMGYWADKGGSFLLFPSSKTCVFTPVPAPSLPFPSIAGDETCDLVLPFLHYIYLLIHSLFHRFHCLERRSLILAYLLSSLKISAVDHLTIQKQANFNLVVLCKTGGSLENLLCLSFTHCFSLALFDINNLTSTFLRSHFKGDWRYILEIVQVSFQTAPINPISQGSK